MDDEVALFSGCGGVSLLLLLLVLSFLCPSVAISLVDAVDIIFTIGFASLSGVDGLEDP